MPRTTLWTMAFLAVLALLSASCEERGLGAGTQTPAERERERKAIQADIAQLAHGKDHNDIEGSAKYSDAVAKLTSRGARIETDLIEALGGTEDWAVRMGTIEVLQSVGTKKSVDHIISALKDDHPLVGLYADRTLRGMLKHRVIPETGTGPRGLEPLPARPANDVALDAEERIWAEWHRKHHVALHEAWKDWWAANREKTKVD